MHNADSMCMNERRDGTSMLYNSPARLCDIYRYAMLATGVYLVLSALREVCLSLLVLLIKTPQKVKNERFLLSTRLWWVFF